MDESYNDTDVTTLCNSNFASFCSTLSCNVASASADGRFAVIQDQGINVYQLKSLGLDYASPLSHDVTLIPNQAALKKYDVGIDARLFTSEPTEFPGSSTFLYDPVLNPRAEMSHSVLGFMKAIWSPTGNMQDGRSLLAVISLNGNLSIQRLKATTGRWTVTADLTDVHFSHMSERGFQPAHKSVPGFNDVVRRDLLDQWKSLELLTEDSAQDKFCSYKERKYHLFTMSVCWRPFVLNTSTNHKGQSKIATEYLLAAGTKDGFLIFWAIKVDTSLSKSFNTILDEYDTGSAACICSMKWFQEEHEVKGYLVAAYTDGKICMYTLETEENDNAKNINIKDITEIWSEDDGIIVNYIDGILKSGELVIVASKSIRAVVFKISIKSDDKPSIEVKILPRLHNTSISGMSFQDERILFTSSQDGAVMSLNIDTLEKNEHQCVGKQGYICCGFVTLPNSLICCAVLTPSIMLFKQIKYVRRCEVQFVPIANLQSGADSFTKPESSLSIEYQEFFRLFLSYGFDVPVTLREYCTPVSSSHAGLSIGKCQKLSFLTWLFSKSADALKEADPAAEEASKGNYWKEQCGQLMRILIRKFSMERIEKWIQFRETSNEHISDDDKTILLLHMDWLLRYGDSKELLPLVQKLDGYKEMDPFEGLLEESTQLESVDNVSFKFKENFVCESNSPADKRKDAKQGNTDVNDVEQACNSQSRPAEANQSSNLNNSACSTLPCRETCPLCGSPVPLTNTIGDSCSTGHRWSRCCLTLTILRDFSYRQCIGCGRYAGRKYVSKSGRSFRELLVNIDNCPVCNGWLISKFS